MISAPLSSPLVSWLKDRNTILAQAFDWLSTLGENPPDGITPLGTLGMYGHVHGYRTRARSECVWESHRHTIDVQVCLAGAECVDWSEPRFLAASSLCYKEDGDREEWASPDLVSGTMHLRPGCFAFFFAGEPHLPMIASPAPVDIRKVVVKIPLPLFEQGMPRPSGQ